MRVNHGHFLGRVGPGHLQPEHVLVDGDEEVPRDAAPEKRHHWHELELGPQIPEQRAAPPDLQPEFDKRRGDGAGPTEDDEGGHFGAVEEPYTMYDDEVPTMPNYEDIKHLGNRRPQKYQPSDFVEEAMGMGYEPKGATGPNSLAAAEQSGELKRQSRGLATRDAEARRRQGDFRNYPKFDYGADI